MNFKNPWIVVGILAVVLIGGSVAYSKNVVSSANEGIVEVGPHIRGNSEATVILVEYSDFECPACAAFQPILNQVMTDFGDKISFEYRHFPLPIHKFSVPAARAAEAAGQQGKFFEYHDALFANQRVWSTSPNPTALFNQYATELGLDLNKFKTHYQASVLKDRIQSDWQEARDLDLNATPTFILNGNKLEIKTFEDFYNQIAVAVGATTTEATEAVTAVQFGI